MKIEGTEYIHPYVSEPDKGEGYEHIILDRRFDLGFGCEWNLGKKYTLDSGLKQGSVTYYQDIGKPFYVLPLGSATEGEASGGLIASSGLEDGVYWQFEEGYKKHFVDAEGNAPFELQDHRLAVNSVISQNDENRLRLEQYNDYLHKTYPTLYPESNPLLVKESTATGRGRSFSLIIPITIFPTRHMPPRRSFPRTPGRTFCSISPLPSLLTLRNILPLSFQ